MNTTKIRKNFVFDEETADKLEKLKNVSNKSATKIVQDLIADSFAIIKREERKKAFDEYIKISREMAEIKSDGRFTNMTIQEIKREMGEDAMKKCL